MARWRFEQIEKLAGVRHLGIYAMKHTSVPNLHHFKIPLKLMQNRLGHSNPSVTLNTYTHLFKEKAKSKKISIANKHLFNYKMSMHSKIHFRGYAEKVFKPLSH